MFRQEMNAYFKDLQIFNDIILVKVKEKFYKNK